MGVFTGGADETAGADETGSATLEGEATSADEATGALLLAGPLLFGGALLAAGGAELTLLPSMQVASKKVYGLPFCASTFCPTVRSYT